MTSAQVREQAGHVWHLLFHRHLLATKNGQELIWCGPRMGRHGRVFWKQAGYAPHWREVDEGELRFVLEHGTLSGYREAT